MKLDKLWLKDFKNLKDFTIDFDEEQKTTVLIGHNGTGKSNLIEALVIIFRDLDLGKPPNFAYRLDYLCRNYRVQIEADPDGSPRYLFSVDGERITQTKFFKDPDRTYLPNNVFAYYSGPSGRLESHFDIHQDKFYRELLAGNDKPLRPLFYARLIHSQFVLLSFFSFEDQQSQEFLERYLNIQELESVLFILKEPPWTSREGDPRFWNARGVVQKFLSNLYDKALAPTRSTERISLEYRRSHREEQLSLFLSSQEKLRSLAEEYGNNREFFKMLESTYISELIREVRINVKMKDTGNTLTFGELSEGEQQLLTVLGLLKFTQDNESLFLLDEPDTHLNPIWKLYYLNLLEDVVGEQDTSHIIICTHDPLVIGGLDRSQVHIFEKNNEGQIVTNPPEYDPKGMGVAALLTSEMFGLSTTVDLETQDKLDRKRSLYLKHQESEKHQESDLTEEELNEMKALSKELGDLDFTRTIRDPLYDKFVRAIMSREEFQRPVLSPAERRKQEEIAKEIVDEILAEESQ